MRDPPAKNKQKIKELTTKSLFHSFEIIQFDCLRLPRNQYRSQFSDYSSTWRSLCEEIFTELVNEL